MTQTNSSARCPESLRGIIVPLVTPLEDRDAIDVIQIDAVFPHPVPSLDPPVGQNTLPSVQGVDGKSHTASMFPDFPGEKAGTRPGNTPNEALDQRGFAAPRGPGKQNIFLLHSTVPLKGGS